MPSSRRRGTLLVGCASRNTQTPELSAPPEYPKPYTLNPKPLTLNPELPTLNPGTLVKKGVVEAVFKVSRGCPKFALLRCLDRSKPTRNLARTSMSGTRVKKGCLKPPPCLFSLTHFVLNQAMETHAESGDVLELACGVLENLASNARIKVACNV